MSAIAGLLIGVSVLWRPSLGASPAPLALSRDALTPPAGTVHDEIASGHIPGRPRECSAAAQSNPQSRVCFLEPDGDRTKGSLIHGYREIPQPGSLL